MDIKRGVLDKDDNKQWDVTMTINLRIDAETMADAEQEAQSEVSCHLDSVTDFSVDDVWLVEE